MSSRLMTFRLSTAGERLSLVGALVATVVISVALGRLIVSGGALRLAVVAAMLLLTIGVWAARPEVLLNLLLVWTVALGLVRRLLTYKVVGAPTGTDPLLLVEPFTILLLAAALLYRHGLKAGSRLSQAVFWFSLLIVAGALNPEQGTTAGITALIFFVPVGAFWIGRHAADITLRRFLGWTAVLAVAAATYGFVQLLFGFPSWDVDWVLVQGYSALDVGGVIRPFASFSSASEYAAFLAVGIVLWGWLRPARAPRLLQAACIAVLAIALFYESSRGIVFALAAAIGVLVAVRRRVPFAFAAIVAVAFLFLIPYAVSYAVPNINPHATGIGALASHQLRGLSDPTGGGSTLPGHFRLVVDGIKSAFTHPIGQGISVITIAAEKFGGSSAGTESDPSNVAVALGLAGLFLYLVVAWKGLTGAYRLASIRQTPLALAVLGLLVATFGQWLNGGEYAIAYLPWLALGWVDAQLTETG